MCVVLLAPVSDATPSSLAVNMNTTFEFVKYEQSERSGQVYHTIKFLSIILPHILPM